MTSGELVVRLAARGDGVTESGRYLPGAVTGDRVHPDGQIEAGPHHVVPPCRHFPECGGCQLQHVDDEAYRNYLSDRVETALAAQGIMAAEIFEPVLSPPRTRRRASLSAERRGKDIRLGFKAEASHRIIDMHECHILHPRLFALTGPLRRLLDSLMGMKDSVRLRMTLADQGADLLLENVRAERLAVNEELTEFASRYEIARLAIDDGYGPQTLWEPVPVEISLSGTAVALPHSSFLQATAEGEESLVRSVRDIVDGSRTVADLFAGLGTFGLALSARVYAAEGARDAALALKAAAQRAQRPIFVDHRDLFRRPLDRSELDRFDAVILDPPRAGALEQVAALAGSKVPRLAYVSCNPATFARDARLLADGGYRLAWIQPVGQFRWSTHVELAARFDRD